MKHLISITKSTGIPLIGCIAFGIIDRGTNLIQVRPTTVCNLNCCFCSTAAGSTSLMHDVDYIIEADYLIEWINLVLEHKGQVQVLIDSVGEPTIYPELISFVKKLRSMTKVEKVILETNGTLLTQKKVFELKKAGLDQINLSLHSLDEKLARQLAGGPYSLKHVLRAIEYILENKLDLFLTPVWLPGFNDKEIIKLIGLAKDKNLKLAIQKYEAHKYGRKMHVKKQTWYIFYKQLKAWESEYSIKLVYTSKDLGIEKTKHIPIILKKGERVSATIACSGWQKNQMLAVTKNRCISINNCNKKPGDRANIRIIENKNNIYIADMV